MTFEIFAVANRAVNPIIAAMSIASAWIWAPALFISAQVAYTWGLLGLLLFVVPNVMAIVLFSYAAEKIKPVYSNGYTLLDVIKDRTHPLLQKLYTVELLLLAVFAISVQLIAGSTLLSAMFPSVPTAMAMLLLVVVPAVYTSLYGIKASVVADTVFYIVMVTCLSVVLYFVSNHYSASGMVFSGVTNTDLTTLLLGFGIPTSIGLLSGIFGSQDFYQRVFCTNGNKIRNTFLLASILFAVVPISIGLLGFIGAGSGLEVPNLLLVGFTVVNSLDSNLLSYGLMLVVIAGLVSTIDSSQMSASTLLGRTLLNSNTANTRIGIVVISGLALGVACSGLTVLQLFLVYGALRSSVFGITLLVVFSKRNLSSVLVPVILLFTWIVLLPVNAFAIVNKIVVLQTCMSITIVVVPAMIAYVSSKGRNCEHK